MNKTLKNILKGLLILVVVVLAAALILAYLPVHSDNANKGITPERAAEMRKEFKGPHHQFTTTDGETIFLRRWNPDTLSPAKKDIAVLIFHGITAHSGAYDMAGVPISKGGYTTFGMDCRGHGLSGGARGDSLGKDRWIADLAESVKYVKSLGFPKVVVLGHSLGVASAICTANAIPDDLSGLILLSGAYEGRKGLNKPTPFLKMARLISSSVFRPSYPAFEYYREGMKVTKDTLFTFRYTPRYMTMLDVKTLRLPKNMNIPVLVGTGDSDELFEVEKVKELYDLIPGNQKEFVVLKNTTHAVFPVESWERLVVWLDKTYQPLPE